MKNYLLKYLVTRLREYIFIFFTATILLFILFKVLSVEQFNLDKELFDDELFDEELDEELDKELLEEFVLDKELFFLVKGIRVSVITVTVCLIERGLSGEGQHIDLSIQEAVAATTDIMIPAYDNEGLELTRNGFTNTRLEPAGLYKCQDGWVCFMPLRPTQWDAMVEWMGNPELLQDPMFLDMMKRSENSDILKPIIQEFVEGFKKEDFLIQAQERHIPTTLVNTIPDFISDPHVVSENSLIKTEHPEIGTIHLTRPPYNVAGKNSFPMSPAPLLGQHNNKTYGELLGLTSDQCAKLKSAGTI